MSPRYLQYEAKIAIHLAKIASTEILPHYYGNFKKEEKFDGSPVTEADYKSNLIIQNGLQHFFPNDGIVSEELEDINGDRVWYIDPIDGTKGFINHNDQFAIHIGLAINQKPDLGLVYKPITKEYYLGIKNQGAFRYNPDGSKIPLKVSKEDRPLVLISNKQLLTNCYKLYQALNPDKLLINGGLGLRLMSIANGISDAYVKPYKEYGGSWDICAPQIILEEAGGIMRYLDDTKITYHRQKEIGRRFIAARNRETFDNIAKIVIDQIHQ